MKHAIIGDVHGCLDELIELVGKLDDCGKLVFVGDLVDRGPDSLGVLRFVQSLGARATVVCGNHESKVLECARKGKLDKLESWVGVLTEQDFDFMRSFLLYHYIDDEVLVVHGGLFPRFFEHYPEARVSLDGVSGIDWHKGGGKKMNRARRFLRVRHVNAAGDMVALGDEAADTYHWASKYDGHCGQVVYGHEPTPDDEVRFDLNAYGIDTGCVFGGQLTALIYDDAGVAGPSLLSEVHQVKAWKTYADRLIQED